MSVLERSNNVLKSIITENKPYTYKLLSRELNIHVNDAKKLLYSFYQDHKDKLQAQYLMCGTLSGSTNIKMIVTKSLDDKDQFENLQLVQIYSLSPKEIKIDEVIASANKELDSYKLDSQNLKIFGIIRGPEIKHLEVQKAVRAPEPKAKPSRISSSPDPKEVKTKAFPSMGLKSAEILKRNRKPEKISSKSSSRQPTFDRLPSREPEKPKLDQSMSKRADIEPSKNSANEVKKEQSGKSTNTKKSDLESMFDDIDDETIDNYKPEQNSSEKQTDSNTEKPNELSDLEDILDASFSQSQKSRSNELGSDISEKNSNGIAPTESSISKGKVEEEVTSYMNEDGYLVTEVKKSKSKSNSKPMARGKDPDPKAPPPKKQKTTGNKQQKLLDFFGKKK